MKVAVGNRHTSAAMSDIDKTVVVVLVVVSVARHVNVVDPDIVGDLDANCVTNISDDLRDFEVAEDDVVLLVYAKTNTIEGYRSSVVEWKQVSNRTNRILEDQ